VRPAIVRWRPLLIGGFANSVWNIFYKCNLDDWRTYMSRVQHNLFALTLVSAAIGAGAQTAAPAPATGQTSVQSSQPGNADRLAAMDKQMKVMREMHDKMVSAKTPEERSQLMAEQMKLMQDSMGMMGGMGPQGMGGGMMGMGRMQGGATRPPDMATRQTMMEKRMDMMQSMMQMMMDRQAVTPAK
jgi:hypothetical protein